MIGSGFKAEWFEQLFKNKKVLDPLKRIADETEEDYQALDKILKDAGVQTYRAKLDIEKYQSLENVGRPPVCPRDHFAVIGEKIYLGHPCPGTSHILKNINSNAMEFHIDIDISTNKVVRIGKDIFYDVPVSTSKTQKELLVSKWQEQGFRVHLSYNGWHSDGVFCVVKPGVIVAIEEEKNALEKEFLGWDIHYVKDNGRSKMASWNKWKVKLQGGDKRIRWWLQGEENNDELISFIDTWLTDWVGYVEETVFDVNMLSIDQDTIICNNYNKDVFAHFKRHKVEPIIFNFRHKYFWDGGVHCITQDLYREGTQEDYFG